MPAKRSSFWMQSSWRYDRYASLIRKFAEFGPTLMPSPELKIRGWSSVKFGAANRNAVLPWKVFHVVETPNVPVNEPPSQHASLPPAK